MHLRPLLRLFRLPSAALICCVLQPMLAWAAAPDACGVPLPPVARYPELFQREIDATRDFVLQVRRIHAPEGWYAQLGYVATDESGTVKAINPTLLAVPGSTMRFTFVNCLVEDDIRWITRYDALDSATTFTPVAGSFNAFPGEEMVPTGYTNIHTHGMHGTPIPGTPTAIAGDEVLTTFVSPVSRPFSDATVSHQQVYAIAVPATQDAGLYWYHPHLHGEAQPQVFLGLTGAIRVLSRRLGDATGSATIASEIAEHADPSEHPAVFVIRDYPVGPTPDPGEQDGQASGDATAPATMMSLGTQRHRSFRAHRERYLQGTLGGRAPLSASSGATPQDAQSPAHGTFATNPRCALVDAADSSPLCLPDAVSADPSDPSPPAPSLATLITVNGRQTEVPSGGDADGPARLDFQPLAPTTTDHVLRVLNASANTYVKLSLSPAALAGVDLGAAPTSSVPTVELVQWRRDGAPVPTQDRRVESILLPPGGRAEFSPAPGVTQPLSLVSQYYNTGPAGDLVPPRTLARLFSGVTAGHGPGSALASTTEAPEPTPERSERFTNVYAAHPGATRRAFAFFEQDRPCAAGQDCGTTFYLLDITAAAIGSGGVKTPLSEAHAFALPMGMLQGDTIPVRDLFEGANGRFKTGVPAIQVSLHGKPEVDEEWDVYNFTGESHAFHIHQLGFYVQTACSPAFLQLHHHTSDCRGINDRTGDENHETGLVLDVINLPPAVSVPHTDPLKNVVYPSKVHLRVPFTQDITGNFVMHCHLLEHEDNGMMMGVQVWPDAEPPASTVSSSGQSALMKMP